MKIKNILLAIIIGSFIVGCTNNFEEINENPNNPASSDPNYIFTHVVKERAGEYGVFINYNYIYVQRWVMQTTAVYGNSTMPPYELFDQYRIKLLWEYMYSNILSNCTMLERFTADKEEMVNKHQIARIWKVFSMYFVTDLWGDAPYSEAWGLLDGYSPAAIEPKYDTQEEIYTEMLSVLADAVTKFDKTKESYIYDQIFDGDIDLWIKFANSLRLRLAVRSGNESIVKEIITANNLMSSHDESAMFQYLESQNWWNPYYGIHLNSMNKQQPELTGTSVIKISELMVRQLVGTNDPRIKIYAQPIETDNKTIRGVPNLMNSNKKENQAMQMGVFSTSYIGKYFTRNPSLTKPLLSYAEVCFLRAEAAFRGWTSEDAQTWYEKGVKAAMEMYDVPADDITTFIENDGAFNNSLEQIIVQKWVALFLDGWEAFAEYRRTGYPQLHKWELELDGIKIKTAEWIEVPRNYVPGRIPYPESESYFNEKNYDQAVERQGGDSYYQQVWWGKKFGEVNY